MSHAAMSHAAEASSPLPCTSGCSTRVPQVRHTPAKETRIELSLVVCVHASASGRKSRANLPTHQLLSNDRWSDLSLEAFGAGAGAGSILGTRAAAAATRMH